MRLSLHSSERERTLQVYKLNYTQCFVFWLILFWFIFHSVTFVRPFALFGISFWETFVLVERWDRRDDRSWEMFSVKLNCLLCRGENEDDFYFFLTVRKRLRWKVALFCSARRTERISVILLYAQITEFEWIFISVLCNTNRVFTIIKEREKEN